MTDRISKPLIYAFVAIGSSVLIFWARSKLYQGEEIIYFFTGGGKWTPFAATILFASFPLIIFTLWFGRYRRNLKERKLINEFKYRK